jgi:predicted metal-binding membrane protein
LAQLAVLSGMPHELALTKESADPLQRAQRRDRLIVIAALITVTALGWYFTAAMAYDMDSMLLPQGYRWSGVEMVMLFVMWVVMMIAMMLPSATPAILLFSRTRRTQTAQAAAVSHTGWFVLGYLAAWSAFSVAATLLQWILHGAGLLSPAMTSNSARLGAVLLLLAGVFQLTSLKYACLAAGVHHVALA